MKDGLLTLLGVPADRIESLLRLACRIKAGRDTTRYLDGRNIGLLFGVPSTRTRVSFTVGATQLGAHAEYLNPDDLQLKNRESLADTAAVLGRFLDALIVRLYDMNAYGQGRDALDVLRRRSGIPIINALDDKDHPCQVLSDLLTLNERFGSDFRNKTVVLTWAYSPRQKSPGVPHSMLAAAASLGMTLRLAHPPGFDVDAEYVQYARDTATQTGARIEYFDDLEAASRGADVIYTKSWKALGMTSDEDRAARDAVRDAWRVGAEHFALANPGAIWMDCMPFIRGYEVTAEIADGPRGIIYDQAENRLHMQKAIMAEYVA